MAAIPPRYAVDCVDSRPAKKCVLVYKRAARGEEKRKKRDVFSITLLMRLYPPSTAIMHLCPSQRRYVKRTLPELVDDKKNLLVLRQRIECPKACPWGLIS